MHRFDISSLFYCVKRLLIDGPTQEWELEQIAVGVGNWNAWSTGVYTANTGSNTLDTLSTPSISDVSNAGTACTRSSVLLRLPVLAVYLGHQHCNTLSTRSMKRIRYTEYEKYRECL